MTFQARGPSRWFFDPSIPYFDAAFEADITESESDSSNDISLETGMGIPTRPFYMRALRCYGQI